MKTKIFILFAVASLCVSTAFAGDGYVTLKKPGETEKKFVVKNLKFSCNQQLSETFLVEVDGATSEIPFSVIKQIKLVKFAKPRSGYRLYFKDSSKDRPLVVVQPACDNVKFVGENSFGGAVTVNTQFMQTLEFE
jgi:hypothetical protein